MLPRFIVDTPDNETTLDPPIRWRVVRLLIGKAALEDQTLFAYLTQAILYLLREVGGI